MDRILDRLLRMCLLSVLATSSSFVWGGIYGSESWGEMYWGDNPTTAPTGLPSISSINVMDNEITIVLDDFPKATGEDGWSAVTSFTIQCGNAVVETSDNTAVLTGLAPSTTYRCTVTANNSLGSGPALANFVTTSGSTGELNIALICAATGKCGVS